MSSVRNERSIRVVGQMRSGNHAVIGWIKSLYEFRSLCFLNNVAHGDHDPYLTCEQFEAIGLPAVSDAVDLSDCAKDLLIYSYEDREGVGKEGRDFLSSVFDPAFEAHRIQYIGASRREFTVLVVRDPFNCFASRLKFLRERGAEKGISDIHVVKEVWKTVARDVLDNPSTDRLTLNYNRWILDASYRDDLAASLHADNITALPQNVSHYGGGSSFDSKILDRITVADVFRKRSKILSLERLLHLPTYIRRMVRPTRVDPTDLQSRWKDFVDDDEYRDLLRDQELIELSRTIFGEIEGTDQFVQSL